jgi:hypothetical protein
MVKDEHVQPYYGGPLATFDGSLIQPLGFVTLLTTFENKGDLASQRTIQVKFLIVPCESWYNCILGRTALNWEQYRQQYISRCATMEKITK